MSMTRTLTLLTKPFLYFTRWTKILNGIIKLPHKRTCEHHQQCKVTSLETQIMLTVHGNARKEPDYLVFNSAIFIRLQSILNLSCDQSVKHQIFKINWFQKPINLQTKFPITRSHDRKKATFCEQSTNFKNNRTEQTWKCFLWRVKNLIITGSVIKSMSTCVLSVTGI